MIIYMLIHNIRRAYLYVIVFELRDCFIITSVHKKGDNTDCNNYHEISMISTSYKTVSHILLSRLSAYIREIIGNHQC
jgi:hypothetical protein